MIIDLFVAYFGCMIFVSLLLVPDVRVCTRFLLVTLAVASACFVCHVKISQFQAHCIMYEREKFMRPSVMRVLCHHESSSISFNHFHPDTPTAGNKFDYELKRLIYIQICNVAFIASH